MADTDMPERWAPVVGYEGYYEVSDLGRVRSVDRVIRGGRWGHERRRGVLMARVLDQKGYPQVLLRKDGTYRSRKVHHLVLEAFVGPCPDGMEACHDNDVHDDARLVNLRWDTRSANATDRVRNGRSRHIEELAARTHCPRRHELNELNNGRSVAARGHRSCLACARAYDDARTRIQRGEVVTDMYATSDARYAEIMAGRARGRLRRRAS